MKKKLISIVLLFTMMLSLLPVLPQVAAAGYLNSGLDDVAKLTKAEIVQLLQQHKPEESIFGVNPSDYYSVAPGVSHPHTAGTLTNKAIQDAVGRLNDLRKLAGLHSVKSDATLNESAQYGAVLCAELGNIAHYPDKPANMNQSFYEKGYAATSTSNLAAGYTLKQSVDAFMEDSGVESAGHRRWQLNPDMGKVGFGYAYKDKTDYLHYVTQKCMDYSANNTNYDFIAWPASGNFPAGQFGGGTDWSITLNPRRYTIPNRNGITVTVTRAKDGKRWVFDKNTSSDYSSAKYFDVNQEGYGVSNAILFRIPYMDVPVYEGVYTVTVSGLKNTSGASVNFAYQVDFFDESKAQKVLGYWDISPNDWYYKNGAIEFVKEKGYFYGIEEDLFGPKEPMTRAMFVTVLGRVHGISSAKANTVFTDVKRSAYYSGYVKWANENGIVAGTSSTAFSPDQNITREQICAMMARYCDFDDIQMAENAAVAFKDAKDISRYARKSVTACQRGGIISGEKHQGSYYFYPTRSATRAEVATILMNFCKKYK